jgi:hypothetical protein
MRTKLIGILLVVCLPLLGRGVYAFQQKTSLSGTAEAITIQMPSTAGVTRSASFTGSGDGISVYCSAQCEITLERGSATATATDVTIVEINAGDASAMRALRSSNIVTGTVFARQIVGAGQILVLDLSNKGLIRNQSITLRTDSITATVIINAKWHEE